MSYSSHLRSASDFVKPGDEVEAVVLTLDREERKMSLGIKQLKEDPWAAIVEKYAVNTKHKATVKNFTNYGIFVELEEGVDGLIHISDLSWTKKIKHPSEITKIDDQIEVVVLEIDSENRRLSLGHKQLEQDPWEVFGTIFELGTIHEGTAVEKNDKGLVISLQYGIEGFAPNKHLKRQDGTTIGLDEKADFKVIEFNKDEKKLIVSHTKIWEEPKASDEKEEKSAEPKAAKTAKTASKSATPKAETTTLGDISALADLKSEMEAKAKGKAKKKKEDEAEAEGEA